MNEADRSHLGLSLAAVAILGLVIAPLLHAEEHCREGRDDQAESAAAAESWKAGSGDSIDALAFALEHFHDSARPKHVGDPQRGEHHTHSHGPAGSAPHGSNTLSHLSVALHAAPQLPSIAVALPEHAAPEAVTAQLRGTLPYLVPEWSQGPPRNS